MEENYGYDIRKKWKPIKSELLIGQTRILKTWTFTLLKHVNHPLHQKTISRAYIVRLFLWNILQIVFRYQHYLLFLKYGFNARCVYYKKMTIIYTVHKNIVLIQRVIPEAIVKKQKSNNFYSITVIHPIMHNLKCKGYIGAVEYNAAKNCLIGKVEGMIKDSNITKVNPSQN